MTPGSTAGHLRQPRSTQDTSTRTVHRRRRSRRPFHLLRQKITLGDELAEIATTQPIVMELLAGAGDPRVLDELERLTSGLMLAAVDLDQDFHTAAAVDRATQRRGQPVHKLIDCLIAAVTVRTGAALVHQDRDFDTIAAVLPDLRARSLL